MKRCTLLLLVCSVAAQTGRIPGWGQSGSNRTEFQSGIDRDVAHGGSASAMLRCGPKRCEGFGTLMQSIRADEYLGRRVRLSAWVKASDAGKPRIWMRVDGEDGTTLAFDNLENRSKSGSFDWTLQQIVLDVDKHAAILNFGLIVQDRGRAWMDDVALEVVDRKVKTTNMTSAAGQPQGSPASVRARWERAPERPVNLDFEQQQDD